MGRAENIYLRFLIFTFLIFTVISGGVAQNITVEADLDTTEFLIGDQVGLDLKVKQPKNEYVGIPTFNDKLSEQIEVLEQLENDTSELENDELLIKKHLLITSFDSGYYVIPKIPFIYKTDTLFADPVYFKVNTVAVDTSKAIKDIKMPYGAPLSFSEIMPWALGGLGLVIIILIVIYIIRKIKRKEPIIKRFKPKEPAHVIAYRELDRLKENRLWQQDKIKDYYTNLTDILRMYLWNRYSIRTLERTSEEILNSLKASDFKNDEAYNTLKDIFYISDLVKFAKFKPIVDEHEKCMKGAYEFVDKTKLVIEEKAQEENNDLSEGNKTEKSQMLKEQNN